MLSNAWLIGGGSLLAIGLLSLLLWSPWDRPGIAGGKTLRLYCAAGFTKPVARIIHDYEKAHRVKIEPSYGGSGALLSTIRATGSAGDLYLAADTLNMEQAQQSGHVAEAIPVAVIRPVLVVNKKTQRALRAQGKPVAAAADLLRNDLKVVLANDAGTSIGRVTKRALEPLGLWARLEQRRRDGSGLVSTTGTVNEVAVTVSTRDHFVGVVWDAVAVQFPELEVIKAPEFQGVSEHAMIGVLTHSKEPTAALQFGRYLTARDQGMEVFGEFRFTPVPDADFWEEGRPHLRLSAGAMLMPAVADVIKTFKQREGVEITTSYDGCGVLVTQMKAIKSGQRSENFPDAYFACDTPFLADVQQWFDPGVPISGNDVVFIVPKGNPKNIQPALAELARTDLKIGLAHKEKSALGKLTENLLRQAGLYEQVYSPGWQDHIVEANAAHDLVNKMLVVKDGGSLDLAVVYYSNAWSTPANRDRLEILPLKIEGARAVQPFAIASESRHKYLLQRLQRALVADTSARHFRNLGFDWIYQPK
jgi:molybdenum ABC transporter molybdate-binding protein